MDYTSYISFFENTQQQGSPKCGILGGDTIEVGGENRASRGRGGSGSMLPQENFENLQHL